LPLPLTLLIDGMRGESSNSKGDVSYG